MKFISNLALVPAEVGEKSESILSQHDSECDNTSVVRAYNAKCTMIALLRYKIMAAGNKSGAGQMEDCIIKVIAEGK